MDAEKNQSNPGGIFIPAGVLLGLGVGFIVQNIPAALFIGLGAGFLLMAITSFWKRQ